MYYKIDINPKLNYLCPCVFAHFVPIFYFHYIDFTDKSFSLKTMPGCHFYIILENCN